MSQPEQTATAAVKQPELVEMGFAKECPECPRSRLLLRELQIEGKKLSVAGNVFRSNTDGHYSEGFVRMDSMVIRCTTCHDTGVVPTPKGWKLIALAKAFVDQADTRSLDATQEIPF